LHQERRRSAGKLGRHADVVAQHEPPSRHLRPIADVEVLGKRVVLPASRVQERLLAPQPRGAVEVEEAAAEVASPLLHQEVAVQKQGLGPREPRVLFVDVIPARLHQANAGILHDGQQRLQQTRRGHEIGVQDEDEVPGRFLQPGRQRACLVACANGTVDDADLDAPATPLPGAPLREGRGLIGGVVQYLDLQEPGRMPQPAGRVDQALHDMLLVEDGQLHGDASRRHGRRCGGRIRILRKICIVHTDRALSAPSAGQNEKNDAMRGKGQEQRQDARVQRHRNDTEQIDHSGGGVGFGSKPRHCSTGSGGYLRKVGSSRWRPQR